MSKRSIKAKKKRRRPPPGRRTAAPSKIATLQKPDRPETGEQGQGDGKPAPLSQDHWGRGQYENNALVSRSISWRRNDGTPRRWLTDADASLFEGVPNASLSAKEIAVKVTRANLESSDHNIANGAIRNVIAMEAQNQRDDIVESPQINLHAHLKSADGETITIDAKQRMADAVIRAELAKRSIPGLVDGGLVRSVEKSDSPPLDLPTDMPYGGLVDQA